MMLGALLVARRDAAQGVVVHTWIDDRLLALFRSPHSRGRHRRGAALRAAFTCRIPALNATP